MELIADLESPERETRLLSQDTFTAKSTRISVYGCSSILTTAIQDLTLFWLISTLTESF